MRKEEMLTLPRSGPRSTERETETPRGTESTCDVAMRAVSNLQAQDSAMGQLDSMSIVDESAKHLLGVMRAMRPSEPEEVNSACNCAKNIEKLMRLKLDVIRFTLGRGK